VETTRVREKNNERNQISKIAEEKIGLKRRSETRSLGEIRRREPCVRKRVKKFRGKKPGIRGKELLCTKGSFAGKTLGGEELRSEGGQGVGQCPDRGAWKGNGATERHIGKICIRISLVAVGKYSWGCPRTDPS